MLINLIKVQTFVRSTIYFASNHCILVEITIFIFLDSVQNVSSS